MNQIRDKLNLQGCEVLLDDFIDLEQPLSDQVWSLKEDMLQIGINNKEYIIDIGWTDEFDVTGRFRVMLIKNIDWNNPMKSEEICDLNELFKMVNELIQLSLSS